MSWKKVSGEGLWQDHVNEDTGDRSLQIHELKVVAQFCPPGKHTLILKDAAKRLAECTTCAQEVTFVVGLQKVLPDGQIR